MDAKGDHPDAKPQEQPDVEMQAIGYPAPVDPGSFAQKLAEIIKRALHGRKSRVNRS